MLNAGWLIAYRTDGCIGTSRSSHMSRPSPTCERERTYLRHEPFTPPDVAAIASFYFERRFFLRAARPRLAIRLGKPHGHRGFKTVAFFRLACLESMSRRIRFALEGIPSFPQIDCVPAPETPARSQLLLTLLRSLPWRRRYLRACCRSRTEIAGALETLIFGVAGCSVPGTCMDWLRPELRKLRQLWFDG
jgi:hypothetical protein